MNTGESPGMRAVLALRNRNGAIIEDTELAELIDRETGVIQLLEALKSFRHADGCFCEASFSGPDGSHPRHSDECVIAMSAIANAERQR